MSGVRIPPTGLRERKLVLLVVDLAGTSRAVSHMSAAELAELINSFFAMCGRAVVEHGGRIVTFLGDGCLAVFDEGRGRDAVAAAVALQAATADLRDAFGVDVELGANVHQSVVAEATYEPDGHYNVMGTGVIHAFRMAGGAGIRITEPVYRQLSNDERGKWTKNKPPAVYTLQRHGS
jgi:class 3 adenylate cyclase